MFGVMAKKSYEIHLARKKARIKLKIMCDSCLKGGLQVPNFKICYEAICLSWISRWISLQNKKTLLNVEGFDKKLDHYLLHYYYTTCYTKRRWISLYLFCASALFIWLSGKSISAVTFCNLCAYGENHAMCDGFWHTWPETAKW